MGACAFIYEKGSLTLRLKRLQKLEGEVIIEFDIQPCIIAIILGDRYTDDKDLVEVSVDYEDAFRETIVKKLGKDVSVIDRVVLGSGNRNALQLKNVEVDILPKMIIHYLKDYPSDTMLTLCVSGRMYRSTLLQLLEVVMEVGVRVETQY
jgi:hypothetical protein